jgi:hypothetical protein
VINAKNVINGRFGSVWVNGELFAEFKSLEAKMNYEYAEIKQAGSLITSRKKIGQTGEGTLVLEKVYSRGLRLLNDSHKNQTTQTFKIITSLADPDALGQERVVLENVTFNDLMVAKFEKETGALEEELSFNFEDYTLIESV